MKPFNTAALMALLSICSLGLVYTVKAETVLLARGDDTFGQGWLFLDPGGLCRVVTPRHVIEDSDGELMAPDLVDSYGRMHPTKEPMAAENPELDLAFLTVGGQLAKNGCSRDRVRATPLQSLIGGLRRAQLDVSTQTERQSITVAIRAVSRDDNGGSFIAISTVDPEISFQKGMSGGTIISNGRPIAMLFEVDGEEGIGVAMRYDLIAAELEKLNAQTIEKKDVILRSIDDFVLVKGRIAELGSGLSGFISRKSPLKVAPAPDRIVLLLDLGANTVVNGVRIKGSGLAGAGDLILESEHDHGGFSPGVRCLLSDDLSCGMVSRRATRLRVTLTGDNADVFTIDALEVTNEGA